MIINLLYMTFYYILKYIITLSQYIIYIHFIISENHNLIEHYPTWWNNIAATEAENHFRDKRVAQLNSSLIICLMTRTTWFNYSFKKDHIFYYEDKRNDWSSDQGPSQQSRSTGKRRLCTFNFCRDENKNIYGNSEMCFMLFPAACRRWATAREWVRSPPCCSCSWTRRTPSGPCRSCWPITSTACTVSWPHLDQHCFLIFSGLVPIFITIRD